MQNPELAKHQYRRLGALGQSPSPSINYAGVHHPAGDLQKVSEGRISEYAYSDSATTAISSPSQSTRPLCVVNWFAGITEGGSSGSGLFLNGRSNNPQLVGQLEGGASSCANPAGKDFYGRFDVAFKDGVNQWLDPSALRPVFRFFNRNNGVHFLTMSVVERDVIRQSFPQFNFEGTLFNAAPTQTAGLEPVHRFYNRNTGTHFYTISEYERNVVQSTLPQMNYEGIAWYASAGPRAGAVPLYRFYRRDTGTHFYTTSEAEKENVRLNLTEYYNFENVAYYVGPL